MYCTDVCWDLIVKHFKCSIGLLLYNGTYSLCDFCLFIRFLKSLSLSNNLCYVLHIFVLRIFSLSTDTANKHEYTTVIDDVATFNAAGADPYDVVVGTVICRRHVVDHWIDDSLLAADEKSTVDGRVALL